MAAKVSVKGDDAETAISIWLTQKDQNGVMDAEISMEFQ